MARLHENTDYDVEAVTHELVAKLEREVLDGPQLVQALQEHIAILQSRQQAEVETLTAAHQARLNDSRKALLKARLKGIKPLLPGVPKVNLVDPGVIPNLRAVR